MKENRTRRAKGPMWAGAVVAILGGVFIILLVREIRTMNLLRESGIEVEARILKCEVLSDEDSNPSFRAQYQYTASGKRHLGQYNPCSLPREGSALRVRYLSNMPEVSKPVQDLTNVDFRIQYVSLGLSGVALLVGLLALVRGAKAMLFDVAMGNGAALGAEP